MSADLYGQITQSPPTNSVNVSHNIIQYVDDTNNIIYGNNINEIEKYTNAYFKLIECFYSINKLKLNPDKTRLMVVCRQNKRDEVKNFVLKAGEYIIQQRDKIKVLGVYFTSGLTNHVNISNIISKVNYRMYVMKEAFNFSNKKSKIIFFKSMVLSVIRYCSPLLIDSEAKLIDKLQTLLMKCTRPILCFHSYEMSTLQIMSELRIQTVHLMIVRESIQFIHKVLSKKAPGVIYELFIKSNLENVRGVRKYRVKNNHKSSKVTNSLYYRAIYLFNCLETEVRNYKVKKLSKYLQDNIKYIFPYNKVPKVQ